MDTIALLRDLSMTVGLSGYEQKAREVVKKFFEPNVTSFSSDALGNLIGFRQGQREEGEPAYSVMLAGHMDEIGLIVSGFDGPFIRFERVGGVDTRTILGQEVRVHGKRTLTGVVSSRPPHVLSAKERSKPVPQDRMFIDVGRTEEAMRELVEVGDLISMKREFGELAGGYCTGKAMDDRAGVATLAICLEHLAKLKHSWDVYAVATVQEETGLKGATVSAFGTMPSIGIAVDVGFGAQQGVSDADTVAMDGGPAVAMGPNIHPEMFKHMIEVAKTNEVPHQVEVAPGRTGTDAWAIQVAREGIPTALLSVPVRYMHTTVETICKRDVERTGRLMALFISSLDQAFAETLGLE